LALLLTMTITGCGGTGVGTPTFKDPGGASAIVELSLRGDPTFNADSLSATQRARHDNLKAQLADPRDWATDPYRRAAFDDSWWISHHLQTHIMGVLTVFRMTGDLELLDHVDELAELMRSKLHDSWRDTKDGTNGTKDGYLNWVMRMSGGGDHNYGKDTHIAYEQKAHATVAMIAYALHNNRDLTSPKDYDYGAHADFWKDYLVNHFEAKWRSRRGTTDGSWPIMNWTSDGEKDWPAQRNSYYGWIRWHYYMGLLTGDTAYTAEAVRMSERLFRGLVPCSTPVGTAYVWHHSDQTHPAAHYAPNLMNTSYAEYVFAFAIDMYFEGFHDWADPTHLQRFGRTMSQYVIGDADIFTDGLYADVGGERERCGIPSQNQPNLQAGSRRIDPYWYARTSLAWLSPWNATVLSLSNTMLDYGETKNYDTSRVLEGMMLHEYFAGRPIAPLSEDWGLSSVTPDTINPLAIALGSSDALPRSAQAP